MLWCYIFSLYLLNIFLLPVHPSLCLAMGKVSNCLCLRSLHNFQEQVWVLDQTRCFTGLYSAASVNPDAGSVPSVCATLIASCFPSLTHRVRMAVMSCMQDHCELEMGMSSSLYPYHWLLMVVNLFDHHHAIVCYLVVWTLVRSGADWPF